MTEVSAGEASRVAALTYKLEAVFSMIERERMGDIPILNRALSVAAIGMRPFGETWVCALVTPWFINLMLLPQTSEVAEAWNRVDAGTKVCHDFPAGAFEFICGTEDTLGPYRMCSLFSPVGLAALFDKNLDNVVEPEAQPAPPKKEAAQVSRRTLFLGRKAARP